MALTPPTPPTPPTAPTVPGARDHSATQNAVENTVDDAPATDNAADGRSFGVHITISAPEGAKQAQHGNVTKSTNSTSGTADGTEQASPEEQAAQTMQQARQAAVQQILGDGKETEARQEIQTEPPAAPWSAVTNNMHPLAFLPLLIVFVAALITFTLRNLSKDKQMGAKMKTMPQPKATPTPEAVRAAKTVRRGGETGEDKNKGRHFEMRV